MKLQPISAALVTTVLGIASAYADIRENQFEQQPDVIEIGSVKCFQNGVEVLSEEDRSFDSLWFSGNGEIVRFERNRMVTLMTSQDGLACVLSFERRPTYD